MMGKLYELTRFRNDLSIALNKIILYRDIPPKIAELESVSKANPTFSEYINKLISDFDSIDVQGQIVKNSISCKIDQLQSHIIKLNNNLFSCVDLKDLDIFKSFIDESNLELQEFILAYTSIYNQCNQVIDDIKSCIYKINNEIAHTVVEISEHKDHWGRFHEIEIIDQKLDLPQDLTVTIESKISYNCKCIYPALLISPRDKKWIDLMVSADPLYITHIDISKVKKMIQSYPSLFQSRLRLYEIKERNFCKLPQAQFNFILCWDYFNYLTVEKIEKYVREMWSLLRPGGTFLFSYNNCDLTSISLRVESDVCAYVSQNWLFDLCNQIGYEIVSQNDTQTEQDLLTHISWAEIKKPGQLSTIRTLPAKAQICVK